MPYRKRRASKQDHGAETGGGADLEFTLRTSISARGRRIVALLVGMLFGGILLTSAYAPLTFYTVDSALASPSPVSASLIRQNLAVELRQVMRQQVGEMNRLLFRLWSWVQLALGAVLMGFVLFGTASRRLPLVLAGGILFLSLLMAGVLVPRMETISYDLDRATGAQALQYQGTFSLLHRGFAAFQGAVALLAGVLLLMVMRSSGARPERATAAAAEPLDAPEAFVQTQDEMES